VDSGQWLLYRYNPNLEAEGKNPLQLDSKSPTLPLDMYRNMENRFRLLAKTRPEQAKAMLELAEEDVRVRRSMYEYLAGRPVTGLQPEPAPAEPEPTAAPVGNGHNGHKQDLESIGPVVASKG
jgi:pyruvate-ferredoxin/flavodoxin oxidoreductase